MNSLFNQAKGNASEAGTKKPAVESDMQEDKEESKKGRVVGWVKVNMEGDVIGRKVDLNAHRSYKTLASALELMFMKPSIGLCTSSTPQSDLLLSLYIVEPSAYSDRVNLYGLELFYIFFLFFSITIIKCTIAANVNTEMNRKQ
jgi:auxin-responsive protein IAA